MGVLFCWPQFVALMVRGHGWVSRKGGGTVNTLGGHRGGKVYNFMHTLTKLILPIYKYSKSILEVDRVALLTTNHPPTNYR